MINVQHPTTLAGKKQVTLPVLRVSLSAFWLLFAIEALVVVGMLAFVISLLPPRSPLSGSADYAAVREAVLMRLSGAVADPLIDVGSGATARSSNVRGFVLNGKTYYYQLEGQRGFDPLSRGDVRPSQIEVVLRDDRAPAPLVIYRVISKDRASN